MVFGFDEAELLFAGDAMQHRAQLDAARESVNPPAYDYSGCFDAVAPLVSDADFAVVNLETPVSAPPHSGYPCFNAPPEFIDALAAAGFDYFLTANNHTLDRHARGLRSTISHLDARCLPHTGTHSTDSARRADVPSIVNVNNFAIAILNYTYGTNGISPRDGVVVDYIDRDLIRRDVERARAANPDFVAVCIHWGDEYKLLPNTAQKSLADFLESIGVDMIIGSHPHVIQPMEFRPNRYFPDKNVFLVYSLGNFISNMKTPDTRGGALAHLRLVRGDDNVARMEAPSYSLVFVLPPDGESDNFRLVPADSCPDGAWKTRCEQFTSRARRIFDAHNVGVPERKGSSR